MYLACLKVNLPKFSISIHSTNSYSLESYSRFSNVLHWDLQTLLQFFCFNGYFFALSHFCLFVLSHLSFVTMLPIGLCTSIFLHFQPLPQSLSSLAHQQWSLTIWMSLVAVGWGAPLHFMHTIHWRQGSEN